MRILVDENIPRQTVCELKASGHDVTDIRGAPDQGMADQNLWRLAQSQQRLLITTDKGFTNHRDEHHNGLLVVRLRQPNRDRIHQRVMVAMTQFPPSQWSGLLVVMRDSVQSTYRAQTRS